LYSKSVVDQLNAQQFVSAVVRQGEHKFTISRRFVSCALNFGFLVAKHLRQMMRGKLHIYFQLSNSYRQATPNLFQLPSRCKFVSAVARHTALLISAVELVSAVQLVSAVGLHVELLTSSYEQLASSKPYVPAGW
jgi:hypothetical protein